MDCLFTSYIFPISKSIKISEILQIQLDNPKTEDEINFTKKLLVESVDIDIKNKQWVRRKGYTEQVKQLKEYIFKVNKNSNDTNVEEEDFIEYLARNWVILRYVCDGPDELDDQQRKRKIKIEERGEIYYPFYTKKDKLISHIEKYFYIISLLLERGDFSIIDSFLINKYDLANYNPTKVPLMANILYKHSFAHSKEAEEFARIYTFDEIIDDLKFYSLKIEQLLKTEFEKIMYIGEAIDIVNFKQTTPMVEFTTLVSIIEMLVTHSPDFNRYNVEESISKQFILKSSILIYQYNKDESLETLKNNFRSIYNMRSKIAHGEIAALIDYYNKNSDEEELSYFLYKWVLKLKKYLKILLLSYLNDPEYMNFIKKN